MAAQRLARGHRVVEAAAFATLPAGQLRQWLAMDEDFRELVEAEREQLALSREAWLRELELHHRQAIVRALADGRVSIVGQFLRLGVALPTLGGSAAGRKAASDPLRQVAEAEIADERDEEELEDEEWLARLPVVEAEPDRESARREALLGVRPKILRRVIGQASLTETEQLVAASDPDPTVYEAWFARQPKPPREPAPGLTAEDAAIVEHVTRHNPPWIRGPYLGYHRPPVPAELFRPEAAANDTAPPLAAAQPARGELLAALDGRIARLLDRGQERQPGELDLAEAVCAVKWPNWPDYRGPVDLDLLRLALAGHRIDDASLHWLGSEEFTKACRAATVKRSQGP
jgi:hypothetical protein